MGYNRVILSRPFDAQIEYLEATGTQYIDTEIVSQNNLVYDFELTETQENNQTTFFGFKEGNAWFSSGMNDANWCFDNLVIDINNSESRLWDMVYPNRSGVYHFDYTDGNAKLLFNNVEKWTSTEQGTYDGSRHVYLFWLDYFGKSGDIYDRKAIGRISYFQIRKNGNLLFDGIPVRKGNEGYIYDRVSGKLFGNLGTGSFVLGQDIPNTTPTIRSVVYTTPYDSEVEYLGVSKGIFIDTGIIGDNNTSIDCGFMRTSGKNFVLIGARYSGSKVNEYSVIPYINGATSMVFGNKEATLLNSTVITNNTYFRCLTQKTNFKLLDAENNVVLSRVAANNTFQTDGNLVLFGTSTTVGNSSNTNFRVYYFKIYSSDTLVRDFIPVRKGSIGYLYDKVSGKLFENKGTGNFILGQDVAKPIVKRYIVPSGLVEGVDYEFVNAFLLTNYNLVRIEPNYPVIFKVKPIESVQNVVVNSGQNVFFIQNYTSSYKRWQAWNYDTSVTYDIPINGINTFTLNANKFIINSSEHSYPSHWNFQVPLVFNTRRSNGTGSIVFYSIKSESTDLRPIRLLRNISGKHTFDRQPKTIGSLGLLDISNQILYFGSGENISVYND